MERKLEVCYLEDGVRVLEDCEGEVEVVFLTHSEILEIVQQINKGQSEGRFGRLDPSEAPRTSRELF